MEEDSELEQLWTSNKSTLFEAEKSLDKEINLENYESTILQENCFKISKPAVSLVKSNRISHTNAKDPNVVLEISENHLQRKSICSSGSSTYPKQNVNFGDEIQELLDDEMVTCIAKEPSRILPPLYSVDSDESLFSDEDCNGINNSNSSAVNEIKESYDIKHYDHATDKSQVGNKSKLSQNETLNILNPIQRLILEKDRLLTMLETKLQEELHNNEEKQRMIRKNLLCLNNENSKIKEPSYNRLFFKKFGMPYFQDRNGFTPMPNDDHKLKLQRGELIVTDIPKVRYWTKIHKEMLQEAIKQTIIDDKSEKIKREIIKLKEILNISLANGDKDKLLKRISGLQAKLQCLKTTSYSELVSKEERDREYDWMKYSATVFNGMHSADECRRFWHVYLHPCINKGSWGPDEDSKLIQIAKQMQYQDWDAIARQLDTNRTAYQCLIHFQTRIQSKHVFSSGKWTKEEDKKLISVINASKIGDFIPWTKVSTHVGSRTHSQVYNRWYNSLNPKLLKGRFTKEEDLLIVCGIEVLGVNYKEMASIMNNRTPNQIRERYERHLIPKTAKVGSWSLDEDKNLLRLVEKYGEQNWVDISKEMKTRTRTQVRQRYSFIQHMMKTKPGWTVENAMRKGKNKIFRRQDIITKKVNKVKKEMENVNNFFNLTQLEKDTFCIEKLKELRDKIIMKNFDLKRKRKTFSDSSKVNELLLDFFKNSQLKPPVRQTRIEPHACKTYLNEILLMTKYFGHDLKLPETEDEIKNNSNLSYNLKHFLCERIKSISSDSRVENLLGENSPPTLDCGINIDYEEPEVQDDMIMKYSWHSAPLDITSLNFSEMFKRAVFDYSSGLHKDIWYFRNKKTDSKHWSTFPGVVAEFEQSQAPPQPFHLPPNHLTTLGLRSLMLSRHRLKQDAYRKKPENEKTIVFNSELSYKLIDQFQETMITLFTWPKVLSMTSISSTPVPQVSTAMISSVGRELTNNKLQNIGSPMDQDSDILVGSKDNERKYKVRQAIISQKEDLKRKLVDIRNGVRYKRKINIDHLLKKMKVESKNKRKKVQGKTRPRGRPRKTSNKTTSKVLSQNRNSTCDLVVNHEYKRNTRFKENTKSGGSNSFKSETERLLHMEPPKEKQVNKEVKTYKGALRSTTKKVQYTNKPNIAKIQDYSKNMEKCNAEIPEDEGISNQSTNQSEPSEEEYCLLQMPISMKPNENLDKDKSCIALK